jgi:hypothetical protein
LDPQLELNGHRLLQIKVSNITGKRIEHNGIKVQLLGQIELASERGHFHDFVALGASSVKGWNSPISSQ